MFKNIRGLKTTCSQIDLILVNCPLRDYGDKPKDSYEVLPPLGLGYIATYNASVGFNVGMIDAESEGLSIKDIVDTIHEAQPKYVGINLLTPTRLVALHIAEMISDEIGLLVGGAHATALPYRTAIEFEKVHPNTTVFVAEAEVAVSYLLEGKPRVAIPGICWIENGAFRVSPGSCQIDNLDTLPPLNRDFFANDPCLDQRTGWIESRILGSRGCPFTCTYCAGSRTTIGTKVRRIHAELIAKEVAELVTRHNVQSIRFVDDLMIIDERRVRSILEALDEQGVRIKWDATGRANIMARFSSEFYDYMVEHGLHEVAIGIESGSERLRTVIHKQVTEEEIWTTVRQLTDRNVKVKCYLIIGIPGETAAETAQTLTFAKELMKHGNGLVRASIFLFRPYPGTEEWNKLIANGWTEAQLLEMGAHGSGERAKHSVLTEHQYAELEPEVLAKMIEAYNAEQKVFLQDS